MYVHFVRIVVLNHLPIVDFRPFKVGNRIQAGMRTMTAKISGRNDLYYKVNGVAKNLLKDLMNIP
jgi:hypothetical protein